MVRSRGHDRHSSRGPEGSVPSFPAWWRCRGRRGHHAHRGVRHDLRLGSVRGRQRPASGRPRRRPVTDRWSTTRLVGCRCRRASPTSLVAESGVTTLETGELTPDNPDGTASFEGRHGGSILVNNHEIRALRLATRCRTSTAWSTTRRPWAARRPSRSTGTATGSASTSAWPAPTSTAPAARRRGAPGSRARRPRPFRPTDGVTLRHGYVFEVDPYDNGRNQNPQPIKALGRYRARGSWPSTRQRHQIYLTEDATGPERPDLPVHAAGFGATAATRLARAGSATRTATLEAMRALDYGTVVPDLSVAAGRARPTTSSGPPCRTATRPQCRRASSSSASDDTVQRRAAR